MTIWIDAQLSPTLAEWIAKEFGLPSEAVRDLGMRDAKDSVIFQAARKAEAIVLTKDSDFAHLLVQHGPPPKIIWLTFGNSSNQNLRRILVSSLPAALRLLESGESIVEIAEPSQK